MLGRMSNPLPFSAAADRNKVPILAVLEAELSATASVLEIASGTGQHVCFFAAALPDSRWQPSEPDEAPREAAAIRIRESGLANVALPLALDVTDAHWPVQGQFDAILCINMIHISPWSATQALMRGAQRHLRMEGKLILYGPYLENGTAVQSNLDFDASLKRRNPEWGLRELEEITRLAASHGMRRLRVEPMPANNLTVVFVRER
jgi:SAM-dependent methyltransferase